MRNEIVLLGPMACGKTSLAERLANIINISHYNLDSIKWEYFEYFGYDYETAEKEYQRDGLRGLYQYGKLFEVKTLEIIFSKYKNCIFDLGAGFAFYNAKIMQEKANYHLSKFHNKFILLPHPELQKSYDILCERFSKRFKCDAELEKIINSTKNFNLNYNFLKFYFKNKGGCHTIFTYKEDLNNIAEEIIMKVITLTN